LKHCDIFMNLTIQGNSLRGSYLNVKPLSPRDKLLSPVPAWDPSFLSPREGLPIATNESSIPLLLFQLSLEVAKECFHCPGPPPCADPYSHLFLFRQTFLLCNNCAYIFDFVVLLLSWIAGFFFLLWLSLPFSELSGTYSLSFFFFSNQRASDSTPAPISFVPGIHFWHKYGLSRVPPPFLLGRS